MLLYFSFVWNYITTSRLKNSSSIPLLPTSSSRILFYDYSPHNRRKKLLKYKSHQISSARQLCLFGCYSKEKKRRGAGGHPYKTNTYIETQKSASLTQSILCDWSSMEQLQARKWEINRAKPLTQRVLNQDWLRTKILKLGLFKK